MGVIRLAGKSVGGGEGQLRLFDHSVPWFAIRYLGRRQFLGHMHSASQPFYCISIASEHYQYAAESQIYCLPTWGERVETRRAFE